MHALHPSLQQSRGTTVPGLIDSVREKIRLKHYNSRTE